MAAKTDKQDPVNVVTVVGTILNRTAKASLAKAAQAYEDAVGGLMLAQLDMGRVLGALVQKAIAAKADRKAAIEAFVDELNGMRKWTYEASHVSTWISAAEGYDSLTAKQQAAFRSLDVFRKIASLPETQEGHPSRSEFVDQMIAAGATSEKAVRDAVSAELKRRKGTPDNEMTKIRKQSEKVAKAAGKDVTRLSKSLTTGAAASVFLAGAKWAAGIIDANRGFDVRAYRDGFSEALHPLTVQPNGKTEETPATTPRKRRSKASS